MRTNDRALRGKSEMLAEVFAGRLPESSAERDELLQAVLYVGRRSGPAVACLIAAARRKEFAGDVGGWIEWCFDRTGLQGSHLHHARAAGDLLLDLGPEAIKRHHLMELSIDSLYAIARIPRAEAAAFCSHHDLRDKTRAEIRALVAEWLGCGTDAENAASREAARPELEKLFRLYAAASSADADPVADRVDWERPEAKRAAAGLYAGYARHVLESASPDMEDLERLERDARAVLARIERLRQAAPVCDRTNASPGSAGRQAALGMEESRQNAATDAANDAGSVACDARSTDFQEGASDCRQAAPVCDGTNASPDSAGRQEPVCEAALGMEESRQNAATDAAGAARPCERMSFEEYLRLTGFGGSDAGEDEDDWNDV